MRRRQFIAALAYFGVFGPKLANAQTPSSRPVVVLLTGTSLLPGFRDALVLGVGQFGLTEGRDFDLVQRIAADGDEAGMAALLAELIALKPAVIVSGSTTLTVALKRATDSIPIVANALTDPVGLGLIASFARPGGNVTGFAAQASSPSKILEILLQIVPKVDRVGYLSNPNNPGNVFALHSLKTDIAALPITLVEVKAHLPAEIEPAFRELEHSRVGALLVSQDTVFTQERKMIADLALGARLPSANGFRIYPEAGGLLSYGASLVERFRRSGEYVGKILKGTKPGELPFEQISKLELVINLKTANALGLTISPLFLARADEVIE
jgi:putative tryptophan/tyrosine transport system substrate-binding protein